jgi:preprotein translocase subunit SecB
MSTNSPIVQNAIRLVKFTVNAVNFESKSQIDEDASSKLSISISVSTAFSETESRNFIVSFDLSISSKNSEDLKISIKASALFETETIINDEFKNSGFVKTNSPAIAFPFLRSYVNTLTVNSGIKPIILPSFNFSR